MEGQSPWEGKKGEGRGDGATRLRVHSKTSYQQAVAETTLGVVLGAGEESAYLRDGSSTEGP